MQLGSAGFFPIDPGDSVDTECMYRCARVQNYSNICYWGCGIDPLCRWGTML